MADNFRSQFMQLLASSVLRPENSLEFEKQPFVAITKCSWLLQHAFHFCVSWNTTTAVFPLGLFYSVHLLVVLAPRNTFVPYYIIF